MMYHLKFSLTGGASCSVGCSPPGSCASGVCSSTAMLGVPSSCIVLSASFLVLGQIMNQLCDAVAEYIVSDGKEGGEDEHADQDNRGGGYHLGAGGADHFAHLAAHVLQKLHPL